LHRVKGVVETCIACSAHLSAHMLSMDGSSGGK
jgi:hypothetical protein